MRLVAGANRPIASVFAVANTFLAWEMRAQGDRAPWFVRILRVPGRVPVVGLPFRFYTWVLTKATRSVWPRITPAPSQSVQASLKPAGTSGAWRRNLQVVGHVLPVGQLIDLEFGRQRGGDFFGPVSRHIGDE